MCLDMTVLSFTLLLGQGQRSESRSKVEVKVNSSIDIKGQGQMSGCAAVGIRGSTCCVQQNVITFMFGAKNNHYQSSCLCVCNQSCGCGRSAFNPGGCSHWEAYAHARTDRVLFIQRVRV